MRLSSGNDIPIEERDPKEVTHHGGQAMAPEGVQVWNPAFDVTPNSLVKAIITEMGVVYPPYAENLAKICNPKKELKMPDYIVRDINLAPSGRLKIDWVRQHMPVLNAIREEFEATQPFQGIRVAVCIHLEAKTLIWPRY
ncbi:hypothetical protein N752_23610 [Desulforamulus aquiferis]|nr:hypothetical protein N752_23610 [Desulforamulus aquiferis]